MKMQTQTNCPINVASIIRDIKFSEKKFSKNSSPKVFPYVEVYNLNKKTAENLGSQVNLSKIMLSMPHKSKKFDESYYHFVSLKYQNAKYFNNEFISKVKSELNDFDKSEKNSRHLRSLSENKGKLITSRKVKVKKDFKDLIVYPVNKYQQSINAYHLRNDSLPEIVHSGLPHIQSILKKSFDERIETKDFSINT